MCSAKMQASSQVAMYELLWELEHVHTTHPHHPPLPHKKLFLCLLFSCTISIVQLHVQILRQGVLALLVLELYEKKFRCYKVFGNLPLSLSIVCKMYLGLSLVAAIHSTVCTYQNLFACSPITGQLGHVMVWIGNPQAQVLNVWCPVDGPVGEVWETRRWGFLEKIGHRGICLWRWHLIPSTFLTLFPVPMSWTVPSFTHSSCHGFLLHKEVRSMELRETDESPRNQETKEPIPPFVSIRYFVIVRTAKILVRPSVGDITNCTAVCCHVGSELEVSCSLHH